MTEHRYFTEQDARNLIGRRVQARVAISRHALRDMGLWVTAGSRGTVTQFASGPYPYSYLAGVAWDDPRPSIPRRNRYPIDWYTEDEYRSLLGAAVEEPAPRFRGGAAWDVIGGRREPAARQRDAAEPGERGAGDRDQPP